MADRDILFAVRNNFYIGAYNNAINEASDMEGLSEAEQTERDVYVYRSYIALGSHDVSCAGSITTSLLMVHSLHSEGCSPSIQSHLEACKQHNMCTRSSCPLSLHCCSTNNHIRHVLAALKQAKQHKQHIMGAWHRSGHLRAPILHLRPSLLLHSP